MDQSLTVTIRAHPPLIMTKREAAQVCGVSIRTLSDWISRYGLPAFKLEGTVRFMRKHLVNFIHAHCDGTLIQATAQMRGTI